MKSPRCLSILAALVMGAVPIRAAETGKLMPEDTALIVTLDVRQVLDEHKNTDLVRSYLERWQLAVGGDEAALKKYFRDHDLLGNEGITEKQFLDRARAFKAIGDALGIDPLQDIRRVTLGFHKGEWGSPTILVEAKFKPDRFPAAVKQIARDHFGSVKEIKAGDAVVWQVPDRADGACVTLLGDTLAITGSKAAMDDLLARSAGKKKDGLSAGMRSLLAQGEKEHLAIVMNRVDDFLNDAAGFLEDVVAKGLDPSDLAGKLTVAQAADFVRKNAREFAAASLGVSVGTENTRFQVGLVTKKAERAGELSKQFQAVNLAGGFALKTSDNPLLKQIGDILLRVRVADQDSTVIVRTTVPHEFVKDLIASPWLKPGMLNNPTVEAAIRRVMSVRLWQPAAPPKGAREVEEVLDVPYRDDKDANPIRHRLDMYLPRGKKDFPVVVLVHGGAWVVGDNRCCGLYPAVGRFLATQGIGAVLPNYRLSPGVKHPEHARDVARAVAWTHKNIAARGGDPNRLYLLGHSAGGHLVALLGTDESYLKAEGLKLGDIKGVIAVSGVYRIQHGDVRGTILGPGTLALLPDQLYPMRGDTVGLPGSQLPGLPRKFDVYRPAFGDDPKVRDAASPLNHVRRGLPPFLVVNADHDLPTLASMGDEFHKALVGAGCDARRVIAPKRNHNTILFSAITPDDVVGKAILEFVGKK